jgi:hypothetical protein
LAREAKVIEVVDVEVRGCVGAFQRDARRSLERLSTLGETLDDRLYRLLPPFLFCAF